MLCDCISPMPVLASGYACITRLQLQVLCVLHSSIHVLSKFVYFLMQNGECTQCTWKFCRPVNTVNEQFDHLANLATDEGNKYGTVVDRYYVHMTYMIYEYTLRPRV